MVYLLYFEVKVPLVIFYFFGFDAQEIAGDSIRLAICLVGIEAHYRVESHIFELCLFSLILEALGQKEAVFFTKTVFFRIPLFVQLYE